MTLIFLCAAVARMTSNSVCSSTGAAAAAAPPAAGGRDRRRRRDAPFLFEQLGQLRRLEDGELGKIVDQLFQIRHRTILHPQILTA